jgi:hypothetical protein
MSTTTTGINSISLQTAIERAPAIAATQPAPPPYVGGKNSKYIFTPTTEIIDHMATLGFALTDAKQSGGNMPIRQEFGAHMVHFQHPDLYIKANGEMEARPQIVLVNSHDGTKHLKMEMGIFRLVCSNGLMIKSTDLGGFKQRHTGVTLAGVKELIDQHVTALPGTIDTINRWSAREMSPKERFEFARQALQLRLGEEREMAEHEIRSILEPKREADRGASLWTTFNVVQEGLVRGGFMSGNRQARAIANPWVDAAINQSLWSLAEALAA